MMTVGVMIVAGCAPITPNVAERQACHACDDVREASRPETDTGAEPSGTSGRSVTIQDAPPPAGAYVDRFATTRIGGGEEPARGRPPRRKKIDVELLRAPFPDAVRFLADSGGFDVVVEAPSATDVTVSLHGVDPYDALELIAEAKGLAVRTRHGVVIVAVASAPPGSGLADARD